MRIIFLSKKKEERHMRTIEKLTHMALENGDFELGEDSVELMSDIFGIKGLLFGKAMCDKRLEELEDKLKEIQAERSDKVKDKAIKDAMNSIENIVRHVYNKGYNDGIDYSNEAHACTGDYERGLNDAWECARKMETMLFNDPQFEECFGKGASYHTVIRNLTPSEAMAKIKEYEEKQKRTCDTCQYLHGGFNSLKKCANCYGNNGWTPKQTEQRCKSEMTLEEAKKMLKAMRDGLHETGKDFPYRDECIPYMKEACNMGIKALDAEWILTSERPPETDDDVIAYDGADAFVAWYGVNGWHSTDYRFDPRVPIIEWMPINPPKAEKKTNESCWKEYYESKFMKKE